MKRVYFNEYNIRMGGLSYLPLVSGLLRAYAETDPEIRAAYQFMPFLHVMDRPTAILAQYTEPPDVACFSHLMWNAELNQHIATELKRRFPDCLIIFGGPHVPMPPQHDISAWMAARPYIDLAVRAEGEEAFRDILRASHRGTSLAEIPGIAVRMGDLLIFNETERTFARDLDYPSPYLLGLYDDLLAEQRGMGQDCQAIIETNRGCPFPCTFCYWGRGGLSRRYRYKDLDRVKAEIDWMGEHQIRYIFNADSNFGMHPRDQEIAEYLVETKDRCGYPEKFRTCFGKNTDDRILAIGSLLHAHDLEKGITLARQSNDPETLENIRRSNIKMATYVSLQAQFNDRQIPVYGEMILGLPGETAESWIRGVDELLEAGIKNQLFIYLCQILPNTEMAEPLYRERFGIQTRQIALAEIHGEVRPADFVQEYEEIVIGTASMPHEEWKQALRFSYVLMLFHSLKLAYYVMILLLDRYDVKMSAFLAFVAGRRFLVRAPLLSRELDYHDQIIAGMVDRGAHRGTVLPEYGEIYWDVEEASFLRLTEQPDAVYVELRAIMGDYLGRCGVDIRSDAGLLNQAVEYQRARMPSQSDLGPRYLQFEWNLPAYFETRFSSDPQPLQPCPTWMQTQPKAWRRDRRSFARESILWGRKSGTLLTPVTSGPLLEASV